MSDKNKIESFNLGPCPFCGNNDNYVERISLESCAVVCDCGARGSECNTEDESDLTIEENYDLNSGHVASVRAWRSAKCKL